MNADLKEIVINGTTYVPVGTQSKLAPNIDGKPYKIVRTFSAGVFAGYLQSLEGKTAVVVDARRIWYWEGANSLSDLATIGTTKKDKCKFTRPVNETILTEVVEVLSVSDVAKKSIDEVPEWTMNK